MREELTWFSRDEFRCSCCGKEEMNASFLMLLDSLRDRCGFPFVVTSGWRCPNHPAEAAKDAPGWHSKGRAVDIYVTAPHQRFLLVQEAMASSRIHGIGIGSDFIHLDDRHQLNIPALWVYE